MTPIKDYALIGNCETAALVNARGGIDWLCMPVFDSPALFAALLDDQKGGSFVVRPTIPFQVEREYHEDSAILVTRFVTGQGTVALTDFFVTARSRDTGPLDFTRLHSTRKLVRLVEWEKGSAVPMEVLVEARPSFARGQPNWREAVGGGFESEEATLFSNTPLEMRGSDLYAQFAPASAGPVFFVLDYTIVRRQPDVATVAGWLRVTQAFWHEWNLFNTYRGPHAGIVRRSAVTLKLLTYAPTGAFVAAPTSSLPEGVGGELNWDYRYTWLRDSMLFSQTLFGLGYSGEAQKFFEFLVRCWRKKVEQIGDDLSQPSLDVFYPIDGNLPPPDEQTLGGLAGYGGSQPVRVGNRAIRQFQLDNYGYVMQSFYFFQQTGAKLDADTRKMLRRLTDEVLRFWEQPDNGVWEETEARQFTYGKVMCWLALQRARDLLGDPDGSLEKTCAAIHERIFQRGVRRNEHGEYLTVDFDRDVVDASEFLIIPSGILPPALARSTRLRDRTPAGGGSVALPFGRQQREGRSVSHLQLLVDQPSHAGKSHRARAGIDGTGHQARQSAGFVRRRNRSLHGQLPRQFSAGAFPPGADPDAAQSGTVQKGSGLRAVA